MKQPKDIAKQASDRFFEQTGLTPSKALAFDCHATKAAYSQAWDLYAENGYQGQFDTVQDWLHGFLLGE